MSIPHADDVRLRLPRLGNNNYRQWSIAARIRLQAKELWPIVNGNRLPPSINDDDDAVGSPIGLAATKEASQFEVDNAIASSILVNSVDATQFIHIANLVLVKDQWDALKKVHDSPSKHRLAGLYRQFHRFEAGTRSIDDAVAHLNSLQYDIRSIRPDEAPSDFVKAITLLDGLGSEYRVLNMVLSNDNNLTFEATVARLKEEEQA